MRLIGLAVVLIVGLFLTPLAGEAQQSAKGHRIGLLIGSSESFVAPYIAIFRQALHALGYVEGGNIAIEYRYADGDYNRLPSSRPTWSDARSTLS